MQLVRKILQKTLLTDELIDLDKQVRLELWAYSPKQFSEDNSADDISIVLSFGDTNDERIEEAVDELQGIVLFLKKREL